MYSVKLRKFIRACSVERANNSGVDPEIKNILAQSTAVDRDS